MTESNELSKKALSSIEITLSEIMTEVKEF